MGGLFNPTEAAGFGAVAALILALLKGMRWHGLIEAIYAAGRTTAPIMILLIAASMYSRLLAFGGAVNFIQGVFLGMGGGFVVVVLAMVVVWLLLGMIPARTVPDSACCAAATSARPWSSAASASTARRSYRRPASVGCAPRGVRSTSATPSQPSSAATCCEMPGCVVFSRAAARVKLPSSTTATKARIWRRCELGASYILMPDLRRNYFTRRTPRPNLSGNRKSGSDMQLGFSTMPIHPVHKDWRKSLAEDREAFLLADELGFVEAYVGEHVTDASENVTNSGTFVAWLAAATKQIRLGTGTVNMPNGHPAAIAAQAAMLDHMLDGRFIFGISPGGLASDAEVFGNLDADRQAMFLECIDMVLEIWKRAAPYDIRGKFWNVSTARTQLTAIGQFILPKPLQRPHPPIAVTAVAPFPRA